MNKKIMIMNKIFMIINNSIMLIIPGILYTYYYPWLYNKINNYTDRSLPLDDDIDLVNSILIFVVTWIVFIILKILLYFIKK